MTKILTLTAAAILAVSAQPAFAESTVVKYGDLDLSTSDGRAALDRRIDRAARTVCRMTGPRELSEMIESQRCYRIAIDSTRTQLAAAIAKKTRAS
jgi:UrcA family protein